MKEQLKRYAGVFLVMNLVGFGVGLCLECGLGTDAIGLLCDGLSRALPLSFGNASLLYNAAAIGLALLAARKHLGLGTIVYALVSGYFIDGYRWLLSLAGLGDLGIGPRLLGFLIGELSFALGLSVLIRMELGMNALDALLYKLEEKTGISYRILRMGTDLIYAVTGALLGGVFGIGTVISVLGTGFFVSLFTKMEGLPPRQPKKMIIKEHI